MKARRTLSAVASASLLGATMLIAAPTASAATSVNVNSSGTASPATVTDTSITVTNGYSGAIRLVSSDLEYLGNVCGVGVCTVSSGGAPLTFDIVASASNSSVTVTDFGGSTLGSFTITYGSSGGASSSATSSAPRAELQQFGKPAFGTCDEAQPDGLNWSGAPNGGWGVSWAQWMNGGFGGEVCTRSLVYSPSTGSWVIS